MVLPSLSANDSSVPELELSVDETLELRRLRSRLQTLLLEHERKGPRTAIESADRVLALLHLVRDIALFCRRVRDDVFVPALD